jgi:transcriptional regulator with XRE-family HTH domain
MKKKELSGLRLVLAENIRRYRAKKEISQEELADLCGLHRTYIGSVERCERNISLATLELLADSLNTTVPSLLTPQGKSK